MQRTFDFAILGDQQPGGLLLAAGLARRSYSVCIVPAPLLGELHPLEVRPLRWPERIGQRKLDELLFKVGFFKLEEAGLSPEDDQLQILLKKNRLSFDGKEDGWVRELQREFPGLQNQIADLKQRLRENAQAPTMAVQQCAILEKESAEFARLVKIESAEGRPLSHLSEKECSRRWVSKRLDAERRVFRLRPQGDQSYTRFLVEHCRKWGVQILEEPLGLESSWRGFHLSPQVKAQYLVVNSVAAARLTSKFRKDLSPEKITHWMYFDRFVVPVESVPEPLGEFSALSLEAEDQEPVILHVQRDRLRDRATITLGIWLPFSESRQWESAIERARASFKKLAPFVPESSFRSIPSPFELNEMKGESVRRGELERLQIEAPETNSKNWMKLWASLFGRSRPASLHSRILVTAPFLTKGRGHAESLEECLQSIEYFEKKGRGPRREAAPAH